MDPTAMDALTLVGINILLWLISLPLGKTWPVDLIWSNWPVYQAVAIYVRSRGGGACGTADRQVLTLSLVCGWGFRLTSNFCSRGGIGGEDWRYADMRRKLGGHFWWVSLFAVFLGQTAFLFLPCLSLYGALGELPGAGAPLGTADWAGGAVSLAGIALEAADDGQMDAFLASAALAAAAAGGGGGRGRREGEREGGAEEPPAAAVMSAGLWAYSRHPNYLGEIMFWWGLYLLSLSDTEPWRACGPAALTLLFALVSVGLMEERQLARRGLAYREYRRRVGSPLLLLPRAINRRLGGMMYGSRSAEAGGLEEGGGARSSP